MPATIPLCSTRGSSARIRMTSCLGRKFRSTETTRTLNGSGLRALEHGQRLADHAGLHGGQRHDRGRRAGGHDGARGGCRRRWRRRGRCSAPDPASKSRDQRAGERKKQRVARSLERRGRRLRRESKPGVAGTRAAEIPGGRGSHIGLTQLRGTDHHRTYEVVPAPSARWPASSRSCRLPAAAPSATSAPRNAPDYICFDDGRRRTGGDGRSGPGTVRRRVASCSASIGTDQVCKHVRLPALARPRFVRRHRARVARPAYNRRR